MMFYVFVLLAGLDVLKLAAWAVEKITGAFASAADPSRRLFLARLTAGVAVGGAAGLTAFAVYGAKGKPLIKEIEVQLARLPRSLSGFTVVQLTDLHLGLTLGRKWVEQVVDRANGLGADLIAITGDLVDGPPEMLWPEVVSLAGLKAPHGVFFVTGNHEYYSGVVEWMPKLAELGMKVLRNERVSIGNGKDSFDLAGVDDFSAKGLAPGHCPDLARALRDRDEGRELVLLAHQPRAIHEAAERAVGLQLSGHTHGGQIWPWSYLVGLNQPYVSGLHRHGDGTQIYVSQGTGYWGPPMRLGTSNEITLIRLISAQGREAKAKGPKNG
jgi:hypothetical protein